MTALSICSPLRFSLDPFHRKEKGVGVAHSWLSAVPLEDLRPVAGFDGLSAYASDL